jgi:tetrahydromethanopterin:alpha-L-glutamate ligase
MTRVAVAGVPGAWSSERMREALLERGIESFVFSLGDGLHDLTTGRVTLGDEDLAELDGIIIKKLAPQDSPVARLRLHMMRSLEDQGVRIFSPAAVIERAMDRYGMNRELASAGLPLPDTIAFESMEGLRTAVERLGDAVVKPVYTSKGRGMFRAHRGEELPEWDPENGRWLAQRFVEAPGRDIGACVLGGRYVGAFYRVAAEGNWMTTTLRGGHYEPCDLDEVGRDIAVRAANLFGLDYTVVDLVEGDGSYSLYEVSAFGGFRGLWTADQIDVAGLYAEYIGGEVGRNGERGDS